MSIGGRLALSGFLLCAACGEAVAAEGGNGIAAVAPTGKGGYRVIAVGSGGMAPDHAELAMLYQAAIKTLADGKRYFRLMRADFRERPDQSGVPAKMVVCEIQTYADRQPGLARLFDAQDVFVRLGRRLAE
ncbi:MAG: hypothetical protein HYU78_14315 [Rhodocyclales bacterium]|nr:hypothetical protein [Rhodocyclales bacterium]